jgi:hypothetical protein
MKNNNNWKKELDNLLTKMSEEYLIDDEFGKQLEWFITNALNQQRINLIKEILESKEVNALGLELPFPVWQSFKEFLTKLEK